MDKHNPTPIKRYNQDSSNTQEQLVEPYQKDLRLMAGRQIYK
jgi:hypothetical protein